MTRKARRRFCPRLRALWPTAVLACLTFLLASLCWTPLSFASSQSVLVVAPHPDDDLLYAAGVVANALAAGDSVKVVYMTNGDNEGVSGGLLRENEAVAGQAEIGTPESDLIFLGYPDAYMMDLWTGYPNSTDALTSSLTGQSTTYGDRGLGSSDYHTYRFGSPALYNHPDVLQDLESIIDAYRPDDIYTTGPFDEHPDHEATLLLCAAGTCGTVSMPTRATIQSFTQAIVHWQTDPNCAWPAPADHRPT